MTENSTLGEDFGRRTVTLLRKVLGDAADPLGDLDRRAGDGDFGTNVRLAMRNLDENLREEDPQAWQDWLRCMSLAWLGVGGTSGPLFGMFYRDLAKCAEQPTVSDLAAGLAAGQATVQRYGEAKVGDKTMIDACDPAVEVLRGDAEGAADGVDVLRRAAEAAREAALGTREVVARRGRASYVGEVSKGVMDPGAAAMALVVACLAAAAAGEENVDLDWVREA